MVFERQHNQPGTPLFVNEVEMEQEVVWKSMLAAQAVDLNCQHQSIEANANPEDCLIYAAQAGNLSAFNQLVLANQESLYRWVFSLVHDEALADDITHLTFIAAFEKISTFRGGSFKAWLFRIARNRSFDELRYQKRHPSISLDDNGQEEEGNGLLAVLPGGDPSPESVVIQREQASQLQRLLDRLPGIYREALELVDLYELDYHTAADVLRMPTGTLKSRVARARHRLREMMMRAPEWEETQWHSLSF
jgi:RNA polymerase sigma-70 factor, ECF subfamily